MSKGKNHKAFHLLSAFSRSEFYTIFWNKFSLKIRGVNNESNKNNFTCFSITIFIVW
jgi:hypothetical protein